MIKQKSDNFKHSKLQDKTTEGNTKEMSNRSAGIVIVRKDSISSQYLFLLLRAYNYWDCPKGKIEEGERVIEAAIREAGEECGITDFNFSWGLEHFQTAPYGVHNKIAFYFLAQTTKKEVVMSINPELGKPEHDEYRWCTFEQALSLTGARLQEVLRWAQMKLQGPQTSLVLSNVNNNNNKDAQQICDNKELDNKDHNNIKNNSNSSSNNNYSCTPK